MLNEQEKPLRELSLPEQARVYTISFINVHKGLNEMEEKFHRSSIRRTFSAFVPIVMVADEQLGQEFSLLLRERFGFGISMDPFPGGMPSLEGIYLLPEDNLREWMHDRLTGYDPYVQNDSRAELTPRCLFVDAWEQADDSNPFRARLARAYHAITIPILTGDRFAKPEWLEEILRLGIETRQTIDPEILKNAFEGSRFKTEEYKKSAADKELLIFLGFQPNFRDLDFWSKLISNPRYAITAFLAIKNEEGLGTAIEYLEQVIEVRPDPMLIRTLGRSMTKQYGEDAVREAMQATNISPEKQDLFLSPSG